MNGAGGLGVESPGYRPATPNKRLVFPLGCLGFEGDGMSCGREG